MAYVVNPEKFKAEGAIIDWAVSARRLKIDYQGKNRYSLQLRWMLHREVGMPTEPFLVWYRQQNYKGIKLNYTMHVQSYLGGALVVEWPEATMSKVAIQVTATSSGTIMAWAGSPSLLNMTGITSVTPGNTVIVINASAIDGLLVSPYVVITGIEGIPADDLSAYAGWNKLEYVGLPVPWPSWQGVQNYGMEQGLVSALTSPEKAAMERVLRGAPEIGWQPYLPTGETVPAWTPPDIEKLVKEDAQRESVDYLRNIIASYPPDQQYAVKVPVNMPPLENSTGQQMPDSQSTSYVSPLASTLMAGSVDPWLSLALGFGTAYPIGGIRDQVYTHAMAGSDGMNYDFMVTARWERGLDGRSEPYEMAAIVPKPSQAIAPPVPVNLKSEVMGNLRPVASDQNWRCSIHTSWDRPVNLELIRPRTYAFMRSRISPAAGVQALMDKRDSGGYLPGVINNAIPNPPPEDWNRISDVDRELPIPANPGNTSLRYGVAHQDIYGQWSAWSVANTTAVQPPVDQVRIVGATLTPALPVAPQTSLCRTKLTIEFLWDWSIRRPETIRFVGRLYATAHRGAPPPVNTPPSVLERTLAHTGTSLDITFTGDIPSAPGASFQLLSEDGERIVANGAAQGAEARRYRVILNDLYLDFASTGHIGFALWALGQERILPKRTGSWSQQPSIIDASDPRPPIMVPDIVTLASLPDSAGECHARLTWNSHGSNTAGYFIYESTETKILLANGRKEPAPEKTLSERLTEIKNLFNTNPSRREFTRRNDKPIKGTSSDITLPRGSTSIHIFIVIGISAGQVESDWPSGAEPAEALQAIAAPLVMKPAPPTIEVVPVVDRSVNPPVHRARIQIGTRPGPRVHKIQLHRVRVDDAAKELDTMGPPISTITGSGGGWNVEQQTDSLGSNIRTVAGVDSPNGSWKRVWYRATAWSTADPLRGYLPGRSLESSAVSVVIPPSTPPDLSPVTVSWPSGGSTADVLLEWTSAAPIRKTPLGYHSLKVQATVVGAGNAVPLIDLTSNMDALPVSKPGSGSGVWLQNPTAPAPRKYSAYIRRASVNDALNVMIQITDPLGRMSERVVRVESGALLPPPQLSNFVVQKLTLPSGTLLVFQCNALVEMEDPAPYVLKVTAYRPGLQLTPIPVPVPLPTPQPIPPVINVPGRGSIQLPDSVKKTETVNLPGKINIPSKLNIPGKIEIPKIDIPGKITIPEKIDIPGRLDIPGKIDIPQLLRSTTVELAVPDIPSDTDTIPPAGSEPLLVRRVVNRTARNVYYAFVRSSAQRFVVRLTSPDGRFDEHTEVVG